MIDEGKLRERMQRIAELVRRLDSAADEGVRLQARELLQSVMDLHGEALERMLRRLAETDESLIHAMTGDPVVSSVLLLYGLHPQDLETRVRGAIEKAQPTLRSYGAIVELLGTHGGMVRIQFRGVDSAFTARTVKALLEEELYAAAPDAVSLVVLGLEKFAAPDFVPLEKVGQAVG
jgi:hypothetical protein